MSAPSPRWVLPRAVAVIVTAIIAGALLASCSNTPRAVLNVPFNFVAEFRIPTLDQPSGSSSATVVMCLDTASAVKFETGDAGGGGIGHHRLDRNGTLHEAIGTGGTITYTTPVLQAGCGLLTFGTDCCHVDQYLAIRATKV